MPKLYYDSHKDMQDNIIIHTGEKTPNMINTISTHFNVEAFTSSPCLLHDCFTFIGVSSFINNVVYYLCNTDVFIKVITSYNLNL